MFLVLFVPIVLLASFALLIKVLRAFKKMERCQHSKCAHSAKCHKGHPLSMPARMDGAENHVYLRDVNALDEGDKIEGVNTLSARCARRGAGCCKRASNDLGSVGGSGSGNGSRRGSKDFVVAGDTELPASDTSPSSLHRGIDGRSRYTTATPGTGAFGVALIPVLPHASSATNAIPLIQQGVPLNMNANANEQHSRSAGVLNSSSPMSAEKHLLQESFEREQERSAMKEAQVDKHHTQAERDNLTRITREQQLLLRRQQLHAVRAVGPELELLSDVASVGSVGDSGSVASNSVGDNGSVATVFDHLQPTLVATQSFDISSTGSNSARNGGGADPAALVFNDISTLHAQQPQSQAQQSQSQNKGMALSQSHQSIASSSASATNTKLRSDVIGDVDNSSKHFESDEFHSVDNDLFSDELSQLEDEIMERAETTDVRLCRMIDDVNLINTDPLLIDDVNLRLVDAVAGPGTKDKNFVMGGTVGCGKTQITGVKQNSSPMLLSGSGSGSGAVQTSTSTSARSPLLDNAAPSPQAAGPVHAAQPA